MRVTSPKHLADLRASGLTDETITANGLFTETDAGAVGKLLNWEGPARGLGPCLVFPFLDRDGKPTGYSVVKPDMPLKRKDKSDKTRKYEAPKGKPFRAYYPAKTRAVLGDASVPLIATEGVKKALAADQHGHPCVGLSGVYGWCQRREAGPDGKKNGKFKLIPDLAAVVWKGRTIFIAYDSDLAEKSEVAWAEWNLAEALRAVGAIIKVVRLPNEPDGKKNGLDDYIARHGAEAFAAVVASAKTAERPPADMEAATGEGEEKKAKGPPAAEVLAAIGLACDLWHDATQTAFATKGPHTYAVRSKAFRHLLINGYRRQTDKVPNAEAIGNALATIEAAAVFDGPEQSAHVRLAGHDGRVYLHLADADSTVIEIDARGWRVCANPPVRFRKPVGALALPMPQPGGKFDDLRTFLNVPDANGFSLAVAWLMGCFRPDGPFPVLVLLGEQGSAKTTTGRVLKRLIDPSSAPVRSEPKESRDLMIQARNNLTLCFDNLSYLPSWLSDAFCRLATGGGFATRELYTNDDEVIFDAKRPLTVNGIEDFVERADLLERSLLIRHPPITEEKRRPESEFWAAFDSTHPKLLGAVLTRVSAGLRAQASTKLDRLPRMADFALFAVACEHGSGDAPRFIQAYTENQAGAHEQALDGSPLPAALFALMQDHNWEKWEGTPSALYADLSRFAPNPQPKDWPKRPNVMMNKLRRLAPNLRRVFRLDLTDGREPGGGRKRFVHITRTPDAAPVVATGLESGGETPSPSPRPSRTPEPKVVGRDDAGAMGTVPGCGSSRDPSPQNSTKTSVRADGDGRDGVPPSLSGSLSYLPESSEVF